METDISFQKLKILSLIDSTHEGTTKIFLVKYQNKVCVCKVIAKSYLNDSKKIQHLLNEKSALEHFTIKVDTQRINQLITTFKDNENAYFLLSPALGLPLHKILKIFGKLKIRFASLIITQIAFILKIFHRQGFIYRDIKASNFTIDQMGRVTMIDLGKSKKILKQRTYTFCGTLHSMPPQVLSKKLLQQGYSYQFDYYGLGILLYELIVGRPPFGIQATNPNILADINKGITQKHLETINEPSCKQLIQSLLEVRQKRLGRKGGIDEILKHQYFQNLNMEEIEQIFKGKDSQKYLCNYDFDEYISDIEDFGIDPQRYAQIPKDDPFYNF